MVESNDLLQHDGGQHVPGNCSGGQLIQYVGQGQGEGDSVGPASTRGQLQAYVLPEGPVKSRGPEEGHERDLL
eukprot:11782449-Prorocentrum_lima.AAC.1